MDHIPKVHDIPESCVIEIPLYISPIAYGETPLGFEGFQNFPQNAGYCLEEVRLDEDGEISAPEFLQSWLFFGLLTETFGGPTTQYNHNDFVRTKNSGRRIITTEMLAKYFWYLIAMRYHDVRADLIFRAQEIDKCLRLANKVLNILVSHMRPSRSSPNELWSPSRALLLSLTTLGEYLCSASRTAIEFTEVSPWLDKWTWRSKPKWNSTFINVALSSAGWCDGEIATLQRRCNSTCLYYLSTIGRKVLGKNHSRCDVNSGCQALQVDDETYRTQHSGACSSHKSFHSRCEEIGPSPEQLADIISNCGIPLVAKPSSPANGLSQLKVFPYQAESSARTTYVAISHVWSDGLGNPKGNQLNQCQLNHIQNLVNALYDAPADRPIPFWIDTLCVPVQTKYKHLRQAAIAQMADIYKLADRVLILDNSLQLVRTDISWVEMLMRITFCPWATRLWTFQEARLGRKVFVQFKDKAMDVEDYLDTRELKNKCATFSSVLGRYAKSQLMANPSSRRLITAIATYRPSDYMVELAAKSAFDDPDMEELRQHAIDILRDSAPTFLKLAESWRPWLVEAGMDTEGTETDETVREYLFNAVPCTVTHLCRQSIKRIRGLYSDLPVEQRVVDGNLHHYKFLDACHGLQGRTTSRLEDEALCLGVLLRADVAGILKIPSMDRRLKKRLIWLGSLQWIRLLLSVFGLDILRWTQACHAKRMRALFTQVSEVPTSIIFWNAPRLRFDGWKWAPHSILYKDLEFKMFEDIEPGIVRDRGLEVKLSGLKLKRLPCDHELAPVTCTTDVAGSTSWETLVVHTKVDDEVHYEFRTLRSWQRLRFRRHSYSAFKDNELSWASFVKSGVIDQLAILTYNGDGVLVRRYGEEEGLYLTQHVELVERVAQETGEDVHEHEIHVFGEWEGRRKWCVG